MSSYNYPWTDNHNHPNQAQKGTKGQTGTKPKTKTGATGSNLGNQSKAGYGTATKKKEPCHTGNVVAFETSGVTFMGGGTSRKGGWKRMKDQPDLVIGPKRKVDPPVSYGISLSSITDTFPEQMIGVEWGDRKAPGVRPSFWEDLAEHIVDDPMVERVLAMCTGGHGRTGTALAILAHHFGVGPDDDVAALVEWLRENYCEEAVESNSQVSHISKATGLDEGDVELSLGHGTQSSLFAHGTKGTGYQQSSTQKSSTDGDGTTVLRVDAPGGSHTVLVEMDPPYRKASAPYLPDVDPSLLLVWRALGLDFEQKEAGVQLSRDFGDGNSTGPFEKTAWTPQSLIQTTFEFANALGKKEEVGDFLSKAKVFLRPDGNWPSVSLYHYSGSFDAADSQEEAKEMLDELLEPVDEDDVDLDRTDLEGFPDLSGEDDEDDDE